MGRTAAIPLSAWGPPGPALLDAMGREHSARDLAEQLREFRASEGRSDRSGTGGLPRNGLPGQRGQSRVPWSV